MAKENFEADIEEKSTEQRAAASNLQHLLRNSPLASSTKKASTPSKRTNSDYIRLYVGEYKEYLKKIAALETLNTGEQVSVSKYVLKLIEADKEKREEEL